MPDIRHFGRTAGPAVEETPDPPETDAPARRSFVVVTKDFSGLGWARRLVQEGETVAVATTFEEDTPELNTQKKQVGQGWVLVLELTKAMATLRSETTYWIFSENCFVDEAEELRAAGQKVFGVSTLSEKLEHDRDYATGIATEAGLNPPPTHDFKAREEGLAFLAEHPDQSFVFKPDDGQFNFMTFVPNAQDEAAANQQLALYLQHMKEEPGDYILQERIPQQDALEVNVEAWMYEGEPFLATIGLEVKRKNTGDLGEMAGCGGDIMQFIPLDTPIVQQTIGKLFPFYKAEKYTGFADVNVLITPDGTPHFLEVCNRFGYNSHVTMLLGLALDTVGNILADYTDGSVGDLAARFRTDIGVSLTLFLDHPRPGLPIMVRPDMVDRFYPFDGAVDDDDTLLLTGYSDEVGIVVGAGPTVEAAARTLLGEVLQQESVLFPDMYCRTDLGSSDYLNAPACRYAALQERGLL